MSKELLGKYIKQVDVRAKNSNIEFTLDDISGISSIYKEFQNTKANLVDVTTDSYKVVSYHQFAYNPNTARMGDKIPIALNKEKKDVLVSSIYPVFSVDEQKIVPEYLLMWFKRSEFDRYARFKSHGSAREIFDWDEMCNIELDIPSIDEQKRKVNQYNVINNRINILRKINDNLEAQVHNKYLQIIHKKDANAILKDIVSISSGKSLSNNSEGTIPIIGAGGIMGYTNQHNYDERVIITGRVGTHGIIQKIFEKCWATDNTLVIKTKWFYYIYNYLLKVDFSLLNRGSTQPLITQTDLYNLPIFLPNETGLIDFENYGENLMLYSNILKNEIDSLLSLKQNIIYTFN